jgi:hypothetical protein
MKVSAGRRVFRDTCAAKTVSASNSIDEYPQPHTDDSQ